MSRWSTSCHDSAYVAQKSDFVEFFLKRLTCPSDLIDPTDSRLSYDNWVGSKLDQLIEPDPDLMPESLRLLIELSLHCV